MDAAAPKERFRYVRLADELEDKIIAGVYRAGEKLPSIRRLHRRSGLSISTVYQAFIELEKRGLVKPQAKSGYFVQTRRGQPLHPPDWERYRAVPKKVTVGSLASSIVEAMSDPSFLQLGGTLTAPDILPVKALSRSLRAMPAPQLATALTTYENPYGNARLREQIAKRSLPMMAVHDIDDLVVTNGCIEAVGLCLQAVAGPGDTVVVESPTYPWFLQLIEDLNMLALEVPTDPQNGIDLKALARAIDENEVAACLLVPNFHNPLGFLMSTADKQALVEMLATRGIPIIEDDIHGELFFDGTRPLPLKHYDRRGMVLYCTSFSKTLAPGLRIGWTLPGRYREKVRRLKLNLSIASPTLNQMIMAAFLRDGTFDRHLRRLRPALKRQAANIAIAVARYFPEGTKMTTPRGGVTLWVELDKRVDGLKVFQEARKYKISIMPGSMCSTTRRYRHCIRLSCGFPWGEALDAGIKRLGEVVHRMARSQ
jgi:DNA-binding transcriptional MocR family regulator